MNLINEKSWPKRKPPDDICSAQFHNKAAELIKQPYILNHTDLTPTLKGFNISFTTPKVVYSLNKPITLEIFGFKIFLSDLKIERN